MPVLSSGLSARVTGLFPVADLQLLLTLIIQLLLQAAMKA